MKHHLLSSLAVFSIGALSFGSTTAQDLSERFYCAAGDMTYTVTMNAFSPTTASVEVSVGEMMDQSLARQFPLAQVAAKTGVIYEGTDARDGTVRFEAKSADSGKLIVADGNALDCEYKAPAGFEPEDPVNQAMAELERTEQENRLTPVDSLGISLGGKMRSGPRKSYNRIAKLKEGRDVIILGRTGVKEDGFNWFKVKIADGRQGYVWGGELCSTGYRIDGLYERCRGSSNIDRDGDRGTAGLSGSRYDWMAFAVDNNGRVGHGVHPRRSMASTIALKNCGSGCEIIDTAQSKCHSLYHSFENGYWVGVAYHENGAFADNNAKKFCRKNASKKSCKRAYSYCQ